MNSKQCDILGSACFGFSCGISLLIDNIWFALVNLGILILKFMEARG